MRDGHMRTIRDFAAGDRSLFDAAVAASRELLRGGFRNNPHVRFMGEVDTPSPDLALRARYRKEVLASPIPPTPSADKQ